MSRLSDISASPTLREYAQGAAQDAIMPVADFLAPTVEVATVSYTHLTLPTNREV